MNLADLPTRTVLSTIGGIRASLVFSMRRSLRGLLAFAILKAFRVEIVCPAAIRRSLGEGGVLVTANHVSLLDGPLIALSSPSPLIFAVDTDYSRRSKLAIQGMELLSNLGCGEVLPLDKAAPYGIRRLAREVGSGRNVMVFPEGRISTGVPLPPEQGLAWILARSKPVQVEVKISGAQRSRIFAKCGDKIWPRILLEYKYHESNH